MMTPSALVKLASTWINNGRRFGPSQTLRGLRNARRTRRRPVRRTRYASGITRCTVRSILSAIDETSSVMVIFQMRILRESGKRSNAGAVADSRVRRRKLHVDHPMPTPDGYGITGRECYRSEENTSEIQ